VANFIVEGYIISCCPVANEASSAVWIKALACTRMLPVLTRCDVVVSGHVKNDAAFKRYRLTVISCTVTSNGKRNPPLGGGRCHRLDFLFVLGLHNDVCFAILQLWREYRAVPVSFAISAHRSWR
jgi:hypothetical protein